MVDESPGFTAGGCALGSLDEEQPLSASPTAMVVSVTVVRRMPNDSDAHGPGA